MKITVTEAIRRIVEDCTDANIINAETDNQGQIVLYTGLYMKDGEIYDDPDDMYDGSEENDPVFFRSPGVMITKSRVMDLLVTALEGGSNYWYFASDYKEPSNESAVPNGEWHSVERCPWGDGHVVICDREAYHENGGTDVGIKTWILNEDAMKRGLELMASEKYIHHYSDFVQGNEDANTADIFLQLSLFGEIVYG